MRRSTLIVIIIVLAVAVTLAIAIPLSINGGQVYTITLDRQGGTGGSSSVEVKNNKAMPSATAPTKEGFAFLGYFDSDGKQFYTETMTSANKWDRKEDAILYAKWTARTYTVTLNANGGSGGSSVTATYGESMPTATMPSRTGWSFLGMYDTQESTGGTQYYNSAGLSARSWDKTQSTTLYARWSISQYTITFNSNGGTSVTAITRDFGTSVTKPTDPTKSNSTFIGWWSTTNFSGSQIAWPYTMTASSVTFYARWLEVTTSGSASGIGTDTVNITINVSGGSSNYRYEAVNSSGTVITTHSHLNFSWGTGANINRLSLTKKADSQSDTFYVRVTDTTLSVSRIVSFSYTTTNSGGGGCVAAGTLITLFDGSQIPIEQTKTGDLVLIWNFHTGNFTVAPIVLITSHAAKEVEIIHLYFSDGTELKVIGAHGVWSVNPNQYVFINEDAENFVGQWFHKQYIDENNKPASTSVQLVSVSLYSEYTTTWDIVTYGGISSYMNGLLSISYPLVGFANTFEVVQDTMRFDQELLISDIETFGLLTYEEFIYMFAPEGMAEDELIPRVLFDAVNAQYLKVAIGKGLLSFEELQVIFGQFANIIDETEMDD
ncbi:MAG: InlB B-repeat-containing protein [Firmicutes bacterium]|nr:InlB B-repeat-containing protein [Bacillota bacterium]